MMQVQIEWAMVILRMNFFFPCESSVNSIDSSVFVKIAVISCRFLLTG